MNTRIRKWVVVCLIFGLLPVVSQARSQFPVGDDVMVLLQLDESAGSFREKTTGFRIFSNVHISSRSLSTTTTSGHIRAQYVFQGTKVELNLAGHMERKSFQLRVSPEQIDGFLKKWNSEYSLATRFKGLIPKADKLILNEQGHFQYQFGLNRKYDFDVKGQFAWKKDASAGEGLASDLNGLAQFVRFIEKDKRSRGLLANNKSNRPIEVTIKSRGKEGNLYRAYHPQHEITMREGDKKASFVFAHNFLDFSWFPEVKKLRKNTSVGELIEKNNGEVWLRAVGSPKDKFTFTLTGLKAGGKITADLIKGKVHIK